MEYISRMVDDTIIKCNIDHQEYLDEFLFKKIKHLKKPLQIKAIELLVKKLNEKEFKLQPQPEITSENTVVIRCHSDVKTDKLFLIPIKNRLITYQPIGNSGYSNIKKKLIVSAKKINPLQYLENYTWKYQYESKGYTRPHIWQEKDGKRVYNFDYNLEFTMDKYDATNEMKATYSRGWGLYDCNSDRHFDISEKIYNNTHGWIHLQKDMEFNIGDLLSPAFNEKEKKCIYEIKQINVSNVIIESLNDIPKYCEYKTLIITDEEIKKNYINITKHKNFIFIPERRFKFKTGKNVNNAKLEDIKDDKNKSLSIYNEFMEIYNKEGKNLIKDFVKYHVLERKIQLSFLCFFIYNYTTFTNIGLSGCKNTTSENENLLLNVENLRTGTRPKRLNTQLNSAEYEKNNLGPLDKDFVKDTIPILFEPKKTIEDFFNTTLETHIKKMGVNIKNIHDAVRTGDIKRINSLISKKININMMDASNKTPLHIAVETNQIEVITLLIKSNANLESKDYYENTPLYNSIGINPIIVNLLISNKADINSLNEETQSPLHKAVMEKQDNIANLLILSGANINAIDSKFNTPLHLACFKEYNDIANLLIKNKADINIQNLEKNTPLHNTAEVDNHYIADLLIVNNANIDAKNKLNTTPLHIASSKGNKNIYDLLIKNKANIEAQDIVNNTPLHRAIINDKKDIVESLLHNNVNLEALNKFNNTPVHIAAEYNCHFILNLLIKNKANINVLNLENNTPLHNASRKCYLESSKLLIKANANIDAINTLEETPLLLVIQESHEEMTKLLIENNANVNISNMLLVSTLHHASEKNNLNIIKLLIKNKADINALDEDNESVLHYISNDNSEIIEYIISKKADVNLQSEYEETPLHKVVKSNYVNSVKILLKAKANIELTDDDEKTPLQIAEEENYSTIVDLLKKHSSGYVENNNNENTGEGRTKRKKKKNLTKKRKNKVLKTKKKKGKKKYKKKLKSK